MSVKDIHERKGRPSVSGVDAGFGPPGDPSRHLGLEELEARLRCLPPAARDSGRVALLVSRRADKVRETPVRVVLRAEIGMPGDAWVRIARLERDAQLTVMQADVAAAIANGQPLTVFGDNLFLDLDLSAENLPTGSRVRVGGSVLEVTPKAHNGCRKFAARFGQEALRFVSTPTLRHRNLRGIYMCVVEPGAVAVGDAVGVLSR